jgi:PAS domain S-box-containing protein
VSAYFEAALDCVVIADASGCIVEFNPAAELTFGYSRDEVLGRKLAELIVPPALRPRHSEAFERFAATGEGTMLGRRIELTGMRSDGTEFPVELALSKVEGEPLLVCGALRDLSESKQAEESLRQHAAEHAALRHVATLVADGVPPAEVFAAVAESVAELLSVPGISMVRFDADGSASKVAGWGESPYPFGTRFQLDDPSVMAVVARTGRPARIDDYGEIHGKYAEEIRASGIRSAVGVPITVDGDSWGVVIAYSTETQDFTEDVEDRLARFTQLVATAIANGQARDELHELANEQAALRRVATLIAREARPAEVFAAVAKEVALTLEVPLSAVVRFEPDGSATQVGAWGEENPYSVGTSWPLDEHSVSGQVARTGEPARVDDYSVIPGYIAARLARAAGIHTAVGVPIFVDGDAWGVMMALSTAARPLPDGVETRLAVFTGLIGTAIANTQARDDLRQLAEEQSALRRVATLIAEGAEARSVFDAVCEETGHLVEATSVNLARFTSDGFNLTVAGWSVRDTHVPEGTRLPLEGETINAIVHRIGAAARVDSYEGVSGELAEIIRRRGIGAEVGAPVIVEGAIWGCLIAGWDSPNPAPEGAERRLASFAELVATAVANTQARDDVRRLADEQAALRRVATLVAEGAPAPEVFAAVAREVGEVSGLPFVEMSRYDPDGWMTVIGSAGDHPFQTGTRWPLDNPIGSIAIRDTRLPMRIEYTDDLPGIFAETMRSIGVRWAVGVPIVVDGKVWGEMGASVADGGPLPEDAEARLIGFTELVATAVSNATTYAQLLASRARIVAAADEARRRIERNLHDGIQQQLVALSLELKTAEAGISDVANREGLKSLQLSLENVLDDVREISQGVHPATLSQWGLGPALRTLMRRSTIPVGLEVDLADRLPESVEIATYYVVSEALANVAKHAQATDVNVEVRLIDDWLHATVRDDGIGGADTKHGSGLTGLIDRVEALGGWLSLASPPAQGTTITVALPIRVVGSKEL